MKNDTSNIILRINLCILAAIGFSHGVCIIGCGMPPEVLATIPDPVPTVYLMSDTSSGILGTVDYADGRVLCILGDTNEDGSPVVDSLALADGDGNLFEIYFDDAGMPVQIRQNGEIWDISYDQSDPSNISKATLTHDGQSQQIDLTPEFNELLQYATPSGQSIPDSGREFNSLTMLGIVQVGLALATCVAIPAAAAAGLVALHVTVLGAVGSAAGGIMTIKQSLSDEPPTPEEVRQALILDVIGIAGGAPAVKAVIMGTSTLADVAGGLSIVSTYAGWGAGSNSPIQDTVEDALEQAQNSGVDNSTNLIDASMSGDIALYINETGTYTLSISDEWAGKVNIYWNTFGVPATLSSKTGTQTALTSQTAGFVTLYADIFHVDSPTMRLNTAVKEITIVDPNETNDDGTDNWNPFKIMRYKNSDGKTYYPGKDNPPAPHFHVGGNAEYPTISWQGVDICNVIVIDYPGTTLWGIGSPSLDCENAPLTSPVDYGTYPQGTINMNWGFAPTPLRKYDEEGRLITYRVSGAIALGESVEMMFQFK